MSNYRRLKVPGGTYFFTLVSARRGEGPLIENIDLLRGAYGTTVREMPVRCDAIVVLPDHLHAVWTLPEGDADFPERWRRIKARFTHALGKRYPRTVSKQVKREAGVWQRRYWEHLIRDESDYRRHVAYCWANPVRHGLAADPMEWAASSIHRDHRLGLVPDNWKQDDVEGDYGE
jgi:putative transposase